MGMEQVHWVYGMESKHTVSVSTLFGCVVFYLTLQVISSAAIMCSPLFLGNGIVEYDMNIDGSGSFSGDTDGIMPHDFGITATHICNTGFVLTGGDAVRTCGDGLGVMGEWSGEELACQCKQMWAQICKCYHYLQLMQL